MLVYTYCKAGESPHCCGLFLVQTSGSHILTHLDYSIYISFSMSGCVLHTQNKHVEIWTQTIVRTNTEAHTLTLTLNNKVKAKQYHLKQDGYCLTK